MIDVKRAADRAFAYQDRASAPAAITPGRGNPMAPKGVSCPSGTAVCAPPARLGPWPYRRHRSRGGRAWRSSPTPRWRSLFEHRSCQGVFRRISRGGPRYPRPVRHHLSGWPAQDRNAGRMKVGVLAQLANVLLAGSEPSRPVLRPLGDPQPAPLPEMKRHELCETIRRITAKPRPPTVALDRVFHGWAG